MMNAGMLCQCKEVREIEIDDPVVSELTKYELVHEKDCGAMKEVKRVFGE